VTSIDMQQRREQASAPAPAAVAASRHANVRGYRAEERAGR